MAQRTALTSARVVRGLVRGEAPRVRYRLSAYGKRLDGRERHPALGTPPLRLASRCV
jgi:hypothetical protein